MSSYMIANPYIGCGLPYEKRTHMRDRNMLQIQDDKLSLTTNISISKNLVQHNLRFSRKPWDSHEWLGGI